MTIVDDIDKMILDLIRVPHRARPLGCVLRDSSSGEEVAFKFLRWEDLPTHRPGIALWLDGRSVYVDRWENFPSGY